MAQKRLKLKTNAAKKRKQSDTNSEHKSSEAINTRNRPNSLIKITTPTGATNTLHKHDYKIGQYIRLTDLRQGHIRYVGQTAFSKHILYGIELDHKYEGKHSGAFKGVKYFETALPNKGIFVTIHKIAVPIDANHNLLGRGQRQKHGRKLSAMIYRSQSNKSRVSFVVPDLQSLLLSPTESGSYNMDDTASNASEDSTTALSPGFSTLLRAYSSEMIQGISEETEEKYEEQKQSSVVQLVLTPTGRNDIDAALKQKIERIKRKKRKHKHAIGIKIPFGTLNSKCMALVLAYLTMAELSEFAFVSQSARDSIRLVAVYDFRYLLYDALSVQQTRKILCVLKFHKPRTLILPMAYFIYDPVILRLFLQFFNVDNAETKRRNLRQQFLYKYLHKLVIDDRDIRPNSWLMRPGNYPWNELCTRSESESLTVFPFELVECFQSLGTNLWELDIRYTANVELSYFMHSRASVLYLSVSAENRYEMEHFFNVRSLTLQNRRVTWEEIERTELLEWKVSFAHLVSLTIINQRFEASCIDLMSAVSWLPQIRDFEMSNCHFNEASNFELIAHMRKKTALDNRLQCLVIKRQTLSKTMFAIVSTFFKRIQTFTCVDCRIKAKKMDFSFFKQMTCLTLIKFTNLRPKKRLKNTNYKEWLSKLIYSKICKYVTVTPVVIECDLIKSRVSLESHLRCQYCKELVSKQFIGDHLAIMCRERFVSCPLCQGRVKRKSLSYHWSHNCREYYIRCFLCPKLFTVKTKHLLHAHVLRHSLALDSECGKYELVFAQSKQATQLSNAYPIHTITVCRQCGHRSIGPVVPARLRHKLIPNECDACIGIVDIASSKENNINSNLEKPKQNRHKTRGRRLSAMKKNRGKKVLPHPFPKSVKLKPVKKQKQ